MSAERPICLDLLDVEEVAEFIECFVDDRVVGPFAALFAGEESGVDKFFQMMADGGLTDIEDVDEVARTHGFAALCCHVGEDSQPGGIRESFEFSRHPVCGRCVEGTAMQRTASTRGRD